MVLLQKRAEPRIVRPTLSFLTTVLSFATSYFMFKHEVLLEEVKEVSLGKRAKGRESNVSN